jgi:hypothetical protein
VRIAGWSGFVRGGIEVAVAGVGLSVFEGVLFTWMLIYWQRMDRSGVGPTAVFGLRFPLYIAVAGSLAAAGFNQKAELSSFEIATVVAIGIALTVPPLYALQRAVALISTLTIGALTALGPFIFSGFSSSSGASITRRPPWPASASIPSAQCWRHWVPSQRQDPEPSRELAAIQNPLLMQWMVPGSRTGSHRTI